MRTLTLNDPRHYVVAALLAGAALAQDGGGPLEVGAPAPPLEGLTWIAGAPVEPGSGQVVVIEFWTTFCPQSRLAIPTLSRLQRQYADTVRIVGIVPSRFQRSRQAVHKFVAEWQARINYAVAWDGTQKVTRDWYEASGQQAYPIAFVVDGERRIAWIGCPAEGLDDVLARLHAATFDIQVARQVAALQKKLTKARVHGDRQTMLQAATEWTELEPTRAEPWIACFTVLAGDLTDEEAALQCTERALDRLAAVPSELGRFANRGLFAVADAVDCQRKGLDAVRTAFEATPNDPQLALAYFSALALTRKDDAHADRVAARAIELAAHDTGTLTELARNFADRRYGKRFVGRALAALQHAIALEPDNYQLDLWAFELLAAAGDDANAAEVGRRFVAKARHDEAVLNQFAWHLLDNAALCGRFDRLALAAAEQMAQGPRGQHWMYLDTLARAKFVNREIEEALRLQLQAVDECDLGAYAGELQERLQVYKKAVHEKRQRR